MRPSLHRLRLRVQRIQPAAHPPDRRHRLGSRRLDVKGLGWIFAIAIAFLGIASALFGGWLDRVGPRRAMVTAALCFGGGLLVAALGIAWHQLWLVPAPADETP